MLPFAHGVDYFVDERKYAPRFAGRNPPKRNKDHEVVLIPLSPSRSAGVILQNFVKSRLAWLILFLIVVIITLSYHAYEERMKQLRLLGYMERVEELKVSMSRVKHHILAGNNKLRGKSLDYEDPVFRQLIDTVHK
ncbi:unnamed protein product [Allacma fusca]|uniref:Uncharacterized protein n=1 Tax=Allacma fusca TaxID=39272 RepID=A0A8J2NXM4_9HEXA|nr:unnamed protein product [Allacma fusca]